MKKFLSGLAVFLACVLAEAQATPQFSPMVFMPTDAPAIAVSSINNVGFSYPSQFSFSPAACTTGDCTFTISWATQTANTLLAGPASGGPAAPTFRALVAADIPLAAVSGSRATGVSLFDDFTGNRGGAITGAGADMYGWLVTNTGTCTSCGNLGNVTGVDANHFGILNLESGTGAAPLATSVYRGTGTSGFFWVVTGLDVTWWARFSAVSTATDTFNLVIGLADSATLGTPAEGLWFSYTDTATGADWFINASDNSVATQADCGIVATAAAWHKLNIHANSTSSIVFSVDGVACTAPLTTNIPTGTSSRATNILAGMNRTVGVTSRALSLDAMSFYLPVTR